MKKGSSGNYELEKSDERWNELKNASVRTRNQTENEINEMTIYLNIWFKLGRTFVHLRTIKLVRNHLVKYLKLGRNIHKDYLKIVINNGHR